MDKTNFKQSCESELRPIGSGSDSTEKLYSNPTNYSQIFVSSIFTEKIEMSKKIYLANT